MNYPISCGENKWTKIPVKSRIKLIIVENSTDNSNSNGESLLENFRVLKLLCYRDGL